MRAQVLAAPSKPSTADVVVVSGSKLRLDYSPPVSAGDRFVIPPRCQHAAQLVAHACTLAP
ncbi:hypothetical protein EON62_01120 [archaeon]|nr:MAG: hypothetical protein EON62_01120 [archaeon]